MKSSYLILVVLTLVLVAGLVISSVRPAKTTLQDTSGTTWQLQDFSGRSGSLSQYRGQVVLINFWASWCGTCREEMPDIVQTYHKYKDRGFVVIGINYGEDETLAREFVRDFGVDFPVYFDPGKKVAGQYGIIAMPTSILIDRSGKITNFAPGKIIFANLDPAVEKFLTETAQ